MTGLAGSICRKLAAGPAAAIILAVETGATRRFVIDRVKTQVGPAATTGRWSEKPASLIYFNLLDARRAEKHFFLRGKSSGIGPHISQTQSQLTTVHPDTAGDARLWSTWPLPLISVKSKCL